MNDDIDKVIDDVYIALKSTLIANSSKEVYEYYSKFFKAYVRNLSIKNGMTLAQYFSATVDKIIKDVSSGNVMLENAVDDVINELSSNGVKVIDYKSGITRQLDTFARQQMLYISRESTNDLRQDIAKEDNITIWEIDAHPNARPSHQLWQGKRYDTTGKEYVKPEKLFNYTKGLNDYGCKHRAYPVFDKSDPYMFTKDQLKDIDTKPFEFQGKTYDGYTGTQKMRSLEREIRAKKRKIKLLESQGLSTTKETTSLRKTSKDYTSFCKLMGTYRRSNRLKV